jgi:hypothetical protein
MNYQKIYDDLIIKARKENRKKLKRNQDGYVYYENHHILPKCLNGGEEPKNKVLLTAKEHFVSHKLLIKIYPDNYHIQLAFVIMSLNISPYHKRIGLSVRDYKYARELQVIANAEAKRGNKNRLGKKFPHTEETKKHLSLHFKETPPIRAFRKGQIPWNKGKTYEQLFGIEKCKNLKEKISNSRIGKGAGKRK